MDNTCRLYTDLAWLWPMWGDAARPAFEPLSGGPFSSGLQAVEAAGPEFLSSMPKLWGPVFAMIEMSIIINIALAVFNMVPVPPLDGSKVLGNLLPARQAFAWAKFEQYGFFILLILIVTGALNKFISPVIFLMAGLLTGGIY